MRSVIITRKQRKNSDTRNLMLAHLGMVFPAVDCFTIPT